MTRILAALAAAVAMTLLWAQPAFADHLETKVDVAAHTSVRLEQGYVLEAHLQGGDGKAVGDATVRFYEQVELLGQREMLLGAATTDGRGVASIQYLPAQTGAHQIVVRFAGKDHYHPAVGRFTLDATVSAPAPQVERHPLADFSDRVPYAVAILVLSVWALIAFALIATALAVSRGARTTVGKEDTA